MSRWTDLDFAALPETLPNAQGEDVRVMEGHVRLARLLLPALGKRLERTQEPVVLSLFGGSGCGKTGTAAALAWALNTLGSKTVVVAGDGYPRRIPLYNDAERLSRFRSAGVSALVRSGLYSEETRAALSALRVSGQDADPKEADRYPFLRPYQAAGRSALEAYLGTAEEQDYDELNRLLADFHAGRPAFVRCLGRTEDALHYRALEAGAQVCILEWTHGGSALLSGVDIPVYLDSTPESTRRARRLRARDANTDSPFTTMVLEIEQAAIRSRIPFAALALIGDEVVEA